MVDFLDANLCSNLRDVINSSNIFYRDNAEKKNYNLICAVMDRLDDSVYFLNTNDEPPKSDNDFLMFLIHACIVKDAIKEVFKKLSLNYGGHIQDEKYFKNICANEPFYLLGERCPADDKFFEYFRSLAFAHPFETSRPQFLETKEVHYSPFLISGDRCMKKNHVGIMVYSNKEKSTFPLYIEFNTLKSYIKSRYEMLKFVINELNTKIETKKKTWKTRKVNRDLSSQEILKDIISILNERYYETYEIQIMLSLLTYKYTNQKNNKSIEKMQKDIVSLIPKICDFIDGLNDEELANITHEIVFARPKNVHQGANYEIGKIHSCLGDNASCLDRTFGLTMAKLFSESFARKWVNIDVDNMDDEEIKLLTIIACYLESQEEKGIFK